MKQLQLTDEEINALAQLIDAAIRHRGIDLIKNAAHLLAKLEAAEEIKPVKQAKTAKSPT